jgi:hypothetical protein
VGLAGQRGQRGGDFNEAGAHVGRSGAGLAAAVGVAGVGAGDGVPEVPFDVTVSAVSTSEDRSPRMRIEQLVDRLRDLVRHSILMRLLLNSDGRWPLRGDPPPVDQLWTDPAVAEEWRAAWHQGAADLGAPDATQPASPLCDSVFDDYPGKGG